LPSAAVTVCAGPIGVQPWHERRGPTGDIAGQQQPRQAALGGPPGRLAMTAAGGGYQAADDEAVDRRRQHWDLLKQTAIARIAMPR